MTSNEPADQADFQSLRDEVVSLTEAIKELNHLRPLVVRVDDRRYTPGDMVPSMSHNQVVTLDRTLRTVSTPQRMQAFSEVIDNRLGEGRRNAWLANKWALVAGFVTVTAVILGAVFQVATFLQLLPHR